ncbi:Homeodomain-related protein [Macrophomina phaseolina MS6]|uniref:Homeodomain-related protein n=1 Tax=Macrophomina phaseolina (strain MS6) TaxID=1126212 RepID=K2RAW3_MACPH|nr:Homeodomain-related protein [Macrophomina phaseolina MS6]
MCEQEHLLDYSEPIFFTPNRRPEQRRNIRGNVRSLAEGVFAHRTRLRERNSKAISQETNSPRTSRTDPHFQPAPRESHRTRDARTVSRPNRSTSGDMEPEGCTREQFGRGACDSLVSPGPNASVSSGSLAMTQIQSAITACQARRPVARDMCIQSISPELSFLIFILPDMMSVKALIYPQDDQDSTASLGCYGGLENVVVKQVQSSMWLVAGTVRNSKIPCADSKRKDDLMGSSDGEMDSTDENVSDGSSNCSGDQFLAKNQRWSQEDDRILCEWVKAGKPWPWIIRQFPMRTPGSVRTRHSMLRRKSTQS